jgi:hypothetical protein
MAYSSNESGRYEVDVTSFPSLGGKWISTGGGTEPVWARRGAELFYRGEGSLQAVRVSTATSFSAGPPQKLFEDHFPVVGGHIGYDVSPRWPAFPDTQGGGSECRSLLPSSFPLPRLVLKLSDSVPSPTR